MVGIRYSSRDGWSHVSVHSPSLLPNQEPSSVVQREVGGPSPSCIVELNVEFLMVAERCPGPPVQGRMDEGGPLTLEAGGTTVALSKENFDVVKENLKAKKACYSGLGNLGWLHNDLSIPGTW